MSFIGNIFGAYAAKQLGKYNQSLFEKEQNDIFNSFGLNRVKGIEKLNQIIEKLNISLNKH